jgi:alpha-L-rhamnosidase
MIKQQRLTRAVWWGALFIACAACALGSTCAAEGPAAPANLRCEYLRDPLGIDVRQPRLAWVLEHSERAQKQSAYQVLVATRPELLEQDKGDQWDSGKVESADSTQVVFNGKPLESEHTYYWKVRYWDKDGNPSPYSKPAHFELALLSPEEWKGQWIGGANQLRTEFELPDAVARARAYICGLGYYELRINGEKVGRNVLDPAFTTFDKRVLYSTYDVTRRLRRGANAVGVMLGEGWYASRALLLQMNIELANGKRVAITSTPEWKGHTGPIVSDSIYDGEIYDSTLETPGWDSPGFDATASATGWSAAQVVKAPGGVLSAEMMPPIRVVDTLVPRTLSSPHPGVYVYDLGQNFSGWVQLRVQGPRGARVKLRFAEEIYDNGMINRENLESAKSRDIYILRGDPAGEVFEPHFTYHGFRYVEVTGFPGTPGLDSVRGRVVRSAVESAGNFAASKPILNQIQHLIRWGQSTNLHSIPTDCDQRNERQGWMGDAQVTAEEAMLNFDMAAFYTNFIRDMRDVQGPDGTVTDTVPHRYGSRPADPAWGTAYPLITWYMYQQYGDRRILEENYDGLKKYVEFLRSRAPDNVLRYSYYGDWVSIVKTPGALVSDFYYCWDVQILAKIAQLLGKSADAQAYTQLATEIQKAFNREFYDPKTGNYANGTQTANTLPLFLEIVSKEARDAVAGNLTNDIVYTHDTHVTTGFIGVKYLLPLLTRLGSSDLAYELATQTTYPSWGYMVENGATTLWELWQNKTGPAMNSHNHPMFGSLGAWFYQALAGIDNQAGSAGYEHIRIEPRIVRDLTWASGTVRTVRGTVSSSWTHAPGVVTLEVEIPVNSDAQVVLPRLDAITQVTVKEGDHVIWEQGRFVPGTPGIAAGKEDDGAYVFDVGSGHYTFKLSGE